MKRHQPLDERLWPALAVAARYVRAPGGEADETRFAAATVPEPSASATAGPAVKGAHRIR
jgi:hypothetical protein